VNDTLYLVPLNGPSNQLKLITICVQGTKGEISMMNDKAIYMTGCVLCEVYNRVLPYAYENTVNSELFNQLNCLNDCEITVERVMNDTTLANRNLAFWFCAP